jgi:hypothetical protein
MATPARVKKTAATNGSASKKVISLTDYVKEQSGYDPDTEVVKYVDAEFFGLEFRVSTGGTNVWNAMSLGDESDNAAIIQAVLRIIHPEDRGAFKSHVATLPNFDVSPLVPMITGILSIASEGKVPTSSGGSSRTTRPKAVAARSTAN